jgi:hypothetical protein
VRTDLLTHVTDPSVREAFTTKISLGPNAVLEVPPKETVPEKLPTMYTCMRAERV